MPPLARMRVAMIPDYDHDDASIPDSLGIGGEVARLARLLLSRTFAPPLSLGIFGEVGSGKSFYSAMLAARIDDMVASAQPGEPSAADMVGNVVQIELDAWHLVGVSPWIALADRIFSTLDGRRTPDTDVLMDLPTAHRLYGELETQTEGARAALEEAEARHWELEHRYEQEIEREAKAKTTSPWPEIQNSFLEAVGPARARDIDDDGARLGLPGLSQRPEVLNRLLEETKTVGGYASILTSMRVARRYIRSTVLVILVACFAVTAAFFGYYVLTRVAQLDKQITVFFAGVTGITALVGTAGLVLGSIAQNQASSALQRLDAVGPILEEITTLVQTDHSRRLAVISESVDQVRTTLTESSQRVAAARRLVAVHESRTAEFSRRPTGANILNEYREAWAQDAGASASFVTPGSVESLIRTDIGALSSLLGHRNAGDQQSPYPERIIVYIDSLDSCGAQTIREYLEATRQLLGFQVFAVVVTIDPRLLLNVKIEGRPLNDASGPEYLARLFNLHLWMPPPRSEQVARSAEYMWPFDNAEPNRLFAEGARILNSPSQVHRLKGLFELARVLMGSDRELPETVMRGLIFNLSIIILYPAESGRYFHLLDETDFDEVERFLHVVGENGLVPWPEMDRLQNWYSGVPPLSVHDLRSLSPIARRLAF